ncbi:MAG: sporulation protein YqfD [Oscillospiraceae bacterium]|nr:sporulation protein YqfD [Oscillospiraceae bacterium]
MIIKILLNYILGYVRIKVEGLFIERFINLCISRKILLWKTRREKSTILYANVSISEYRKLREVIRKTKSRVKINAKKGLPFILHKHRKRKVFGALLLLVLIGLWVSSNFIWNIEIRGDLSISHEEMIQTLEEEGLSIGTRKSRLDKNQVINNVRLNRDDIAWIGINIRGTNAIVEIREKIQPPEIIREYEYCNIISNRNGIITRISLRNGTANVQVGDIVSEGDVLVWRSNRITICRTEICT